MIIWEEIDTVLLDMDGTLLDLHFDNYFWLEHLPRRYAEKHQLPFEEVQQRLRSHYDEIRGSLNWYCVDYWSSTLGMNLRELKEEIAEKIQPRLDALEFLVWLEAQGKQRILITNAHPSSLELKLEVTDIGDHLDEVISSHEFGHPKEASQFWSRLFQRTGINPERTLFADDTDAILAAAEKAGISHLLHINKPDMNLDSNPIDHYPSITHFSEVYPVTDKPQVERGE